jgi:hypothetical protein
MENVANQLECQNIRERNIRVNIADVLSFCVYIAIKHNPEIYHQNTEPKEVMVHLHGFALLGIFSAKLSYECHYWKRIL